jgi:NAD(P)-dependent dehydrogenase (short-subunit alcohol dehydrogenase family)
MKTIKELSDLTGRTAIVTGGSGHIGSAMADVLAELGASIAIIDNDLEKGQLVAEDLMKRHSVEAELFPVDLTSESEIREIPARVMNRFGRLDILVHAAGVVASDELKGWSVPFAQQSLEAWQLALAVNLSAPFMLTQACSKMLGESGHGSVVCIASIYGLVGPDLDLYENTELGSPAGYAASKGGLIQLTRWMSTVLAPNIRVNAISPGGVRRGQPASFDRKYSDRTPLNRMADEDDLRGAIAYFCTDLSQYVTGQNLAVDGGWTAW